MNIILLFEGTNNELNEDPSVISKLYLSLENDYSKGQLVHLEAGSKRSVTGRDSLEIVYKHYQWLLQVVANHKIAITDIEVFVFGFSRGAYQSLLFSDAVNRLGLDSILRSFDEFELAYCTAISNSRHGEGAGLISYIGLFDVVREVSGNQEWKDVVPVREIRCRHAVAINEYRPKFKPKVFTSLKVPKFEEQLFIGSHSDIGMAYNGEEQVFLNGVASVLKVLHKDVSRVNHKETRFLGRLACTWVVDPVRTRLKWRDDSLLFARGKQDIYAYDYMILLLCFPYIVHDSTLEISNALDGFRAVVRDVQEVGYHESVRIVISLLEKGLLKSVRCKKDGETRLRKVLLDSLKLLPGAAEILKLTATDCRASIQALSGKFRTIQQTVAATKNYPHTYKQDFDEIAKRSPSVAAMLKCLLNVRSLRRKRRPKLWA